MTDLSILFPSILNGLTTGAVYALIALGLTLIYGVLYIINFAHGALFMTGALLTWMAMNYFGINYWLMLVLAPLVQAIRQFEAQGFAPLRTAFHGRDLLYGHEVQCSDGTTGMARGVDASGALLLHTPQGLKKVTSSEVSVRPLVQASDNTA